MNEQTKLKIERDIWPQCVCDLNKDTGEVVKNYFDKYKFAELIVRECAAYFRDAEGTAHGLEEHFGINDE